MARTTPRVEEATLVATSSLADTIGVGTPAWYAWLEEATTFAFVGLQGRFTARKERRGRTGWYWKAYRKQAGQVRSAYLGKSTDLSLDRLNAIASELAGRTSEPPQLKSISDVGPALDESNSEPSLESSAPQPTGTVTFLFTDIEGSTQRWEQHPEILRQIAAGNSNQAIADTLTIAVSTVKRHINNIYGKLDVQSRTQALLRARELNLL
jgi:DNA-binding NarL/FixJ family response regulator